MKEIKGTGIALVTPFNEDFSVDYSGLERLLDHVINKVDYLVLMGTTAESVVLTKKEKQEVVDFCNESTQIFQYHLLDPTQSME